VSRGHRARAIGFAAAAALCAALAATAAGGGADPQSDLGELREVVVTSRPLAPGRRLRARDVARVLEVRRVPARFLPPGALASPAEAAGRAPVATIPAGTYLLASQLELPREPSGRDPDLDAGRHPVEIEVAAAGALASRPRPDRRVDVVVTTEPGPGGGAGRTYVAAETVQLLDLRSSDPGAGGDPLPEAPPATWTATLALRRAQALRLIQAEAFARSVRLIPR
jgi:Flp pilus assembly protein CpaB